MKWEKRTGLPALPFVLFLHVRASMLLSCDSSIAPTPALFFLHHMDGRPGVFEIAFLRLEFLRHVFSLSLLMERTAASGMHYFLFAYPAQPVGFSIQAQGNSSEKKRMAGRRNKWYQIPVSKTPRYGERK